MIKPIKMKHINVQNIKKIKQVYLKDKMEKGRESASSRVEKS